MLSLLSLSKSEEKFINIIIMYLQILNCWNFVFINVGIGLTMTVIIMSMEFIFLHLTLVKHCIIKIGLIGLLLFGIMCWKNLIYTMVNNYISFNNNVYIIITITIILLSLRVALFIIMMTNKFFRHESWNFDEVIDIDEIKEENDNEEKEKENEKEENKDNNIVEENEIKEKENEKEENKEDNIVEENEIKEKEE